MPTWTNARIFGLSHMWPIHWDVDVSIPQSLLLNIEEIWAAPPWERFMSSRPVEVGSSESLRLVQIHRVICCWRGDGIPTGMKFAHRAEQKKSDWFSS